MTFQQLKIHLVDNYRLDVGCAFSLNGISSELQVRRCEDARLSVLDVHIMDGGKIANGAGNSNVYVVFYAPSLRAVPHTQIPVPLVGAKKGRR